MAEFDAERVDETVIFGKLSLVKGLDPIARALKRVLPLKIVYPLVRWKNVLLTLLSFQLSRRRPEVAKAIVRSYFRIDMRGLEHLPKTGPVLIAGNHTGWLDGPLVQMLLPRSTSFLVKSELYNSPARPFLEFSQQIPIRRGAPDRTALRRAVSVLTGGGGANPYGIYDIDRQPLAQRTSRPTPASDAMEGQPQPDAQDTGGGDWGDESADEADSDPDEDLGGGGDWGDDGSDDSTGGGGGW